MKTENTLDIEKEYREIKKQFSEVLRQYPEEKNNSVGYVLEHLHPYHVHAAFILHKGKGMAINAYNLHDLIVRYSECAYYSDNPELSVYDGLDLPKGQFNPVDLIEYFIAIKQIAEG